MKNVILKINGMSCGHCVKRVENALKDLEGVKNANVSLEKSSAEVDYDESKVSPDKMIEAIKEIEYEASL